MNCPHPLPLPRRWGGVMEVKTGNIVTPAEAGTSINIALRQAQDERCNVR